VCTENSIRHRRRERTGYARGLMTDLLKLILSILASLFRSEHCWRRKIWSCGSKSMCSSSCSGTASWHDCCLSEKMAFRPDLCDAGAVDAPNWCKHRPLRAGELAVAPDGTASRILIRDTWNTEIVLELAPESDDVVLYKHRFSGFYETDLDRVLKSRFIKESDFYWLHH
jgi:Isochorismatase family